jgi:hypothetical protein
MNKTISINPDLFTFSSSKRKSKKREPKDGSEIKVKPPISEKQKKKQLRKQHILRHLRQQQENNYKKLMESDEPKKPPKQSSHDFKSDFNASVDYFKNLPQPKQQSNHNYTSKVHHEPNQNNVSQLLHSSMEPLIHSDSFNVNTGGNSIHLSKPVFGNVSTPTWGCLKNGSLPTFRDWKRGTQKVVPDHSGGGKINQVTSMMKAKKDIPQPKLRHKKQKRTIRRTYKVGRSKVFSKISVLISNKTIRNNIMNKSQQLKQMPINDIRKYLVKHGFIRVGSSAPNDVLRKMYETSKLICGEIENHNSSNLLYNYLNDV